MDITLILFFPGFLRRDHLIGVELLSYHTRRPHHQRGACPYPWDKGTHSPLLREKTHKGTTWSFISSVLLILLELPLR